MRCTHPHMKIQAKPEMYYLFTVPKRPKDIVLKQNDTRRGKARRKSGNKRRKNSSKRNREVHEMHDEKEKRKKKEKNRIMRNENPILYFSRIVHMCMVFTFPYVYLCLRCSITSVSHLIYCHIKYVFRCTIYYYMFAVCLQI